MGRAAAISVVGAGSAGKTRVIEHVLPLLAARGLSVGTMKHASHGFSVDREGSDSWRHREAGASPVLLSGDGDRVLFTSGPAPLATLVARHFRDVDLVLAEGFSSEPGPKVFVHRRGIEPRPSPPPDEVVFSVTDEPLGHGREVDPDDFETMASLLAERAAVDNGRAVLIVDGEPVPLTDFVSRFLTGALSGMVGELKGIPDDPEEIELFVKIA